MPRKDSGRNIKIMVNAYPEKGKVVPCNSLASAPVSAPPSKWRISEYL